jgi:hypothetical protein
MLNYSPATSLETGLQHVLNWYRNAPVVVYLKKYDPLRQRNIRRRKMFSLLFIDTERVWRGGQDSCSP